MIFTDLVDILPSLKEGEDANFRFLKRPLLALSGFWGWGIGPLKSRWCARY